MVENIWSEYLKEQLADRLRVYSKPQENYPSLPGRWIAMSILQKAIRRSDCYQALRASKYLINDDYRTFWRQAVGHAGFPRCRPVWQSFGLRRNDRVSFSLDQCKNYKGNKTGQKCMRPKIRKLDVRFEDIRA